jgi:hypothetical protein
VAILKAFEEQGILRAFRVEEAFVDAQLFDSRDRLTVRQDGLDLQLFTPDADSGRAVHAIELALRAVAPENPRMVSASFQHITDLAPLDFEEAVRRGYGGVLGNLTAGGLRFGDWAVLADITLDQPPATGVVEFGIIRAEEAPRRLARDAGRAHGDRGSAQRWAAHEFPAVAVFSDATVRGPLESRDALVASATEFWCKARTEAGSLSARLSEILLTDNAGRVESK